MYLQPFLQGYPAFNDFPALYEGIGNLTRLLGRDIQPLFQMDQHKGFLGAVNAVVVNIEGNLQPYMNAIGTIVYEFGNINPGNQSQILMEIREITGKRKNGDIALSSCIDEFK